MDHGRVSRSFADRHPGQSCSAGSRVLVQDTVYDEFVALFIKATEAFKVGDPYDSDTFQGPQVSEVQFNKILGYIEAGKKDGAKLVTGGGRHGTKGYFVQPTVFTEVDMSMTIAKEEIFGPVASIIRFKTEEEAIQIANGTEVSTNFSGPTDIQSTVLLLLCTAPTTARSTR